uniref:Uncharacterized protein n=1 Tax=uncultured bacterium contig00076 TaxID=1181554 RepID=A0A806K1I1_9BACT|nr:hypothetical protein [uncultured bacterium contig00076]
MREALTPRPPSPRNCTQSALREQPQRRAAKKHITKTMINFFIGKPIPSD